MPIKRRLPVEPRSYVIAAVLTTLVLLLVLVGIALAFKVTAEDAMAAREASEGLPSALPTERSTPEPLAVFIGDSYSAGAGADSASKGWVDLVASAKRWQVVNDALGGTGYVTTATEGVRACGQADCPNYSGVLTRVVGEKPDIVVVSGGRNDVGQPDKSLQSSIMKFFDNLRKALPEAKIYATSPIWQNTTPPSQLSEIASYVKTSCGAVQCAYLDIGEPLAGHASDIGSDGIHPNNAGHAAIAAAVEKALR